MTSQHLPQYATAGWQPPPTYGGPGVERNQTLPPQANAALDVVDDYAGPREWGYMNSQDESYDWPIKKHANDLKVFDVNLKVKVKPKGIFLGLGTLVMFLLVLIPGWNAIGLLNDPVYIYIAGSQKAGWLLTCCVLVVVFCYFGLLTFLNRSRPEARNEQNMLTMSSTFLSALGILLILFGGPMVDAASSGSAEFNGNNCRIGTKTKQLYIASMELESLRSEKYCSQQTSVEDCEGFKWYQKQSEALILKTMESDYQCSGMCQGRDKKGEWIYPPTLFSKADYKVSCDGQTSRHLYNFAEELSKQIVAEGIMLVAVALMFTFYQLVGFGTTSEAGQEAKASKSYGATL